MNEKILNTAIELSLDGIQVELSQEENLTYGYFLELSHGKGGDA